jgi:ParB-like chromosome segregation protein Spo0J
MRIVDVPIDKIYVPAARKKTLDEEKVMELAEDILENGLQKPGRQGALRPARRPTPR